MVDFNYYAPTEVAFGAKSEQQIATLVKKYGGSKVLLHYGGQSAERSGLLGSIRTMLGDAGIEYVELGGVVPNPLLSKVREGISLCKENGVDFLLAVGGGSVIDSAKAIAYGVLYEGDVWDFYEHKAEAERALPVGVVLTIPAAGSEMSEASVITNSDGNYKRGYGSDLVRPRFAVMNPERTYTLPPYQTACGVVDMMMHTMERYFSHEDDMSLTDNIAETILRTVMDSAVELKNNPEDYRHRAQIMWAGSLAHNGLTGCGTNGDWATHQLEHELSAMFDVAHGAGLAAIWGSWARYVCKDNIMRFARFAVNVMGVPNDFKNPEHLAQRGIEAMENFYRSIGMPTNIKELLNRKLTDEEIKEMARKCSLDRTITVGQFHKLGYDDMAAIYTMANAD